ncbi:hypothetical protein M3Y97_01045800 [Aphelenchoides bicaudatus]|nr:hypothetical protein M3Y97_01045800 [Aphelenchoides bicaudatus]
MQRHASQYGNTLHEAAFSDYIEIVKLLIESGADVNAKNNRGDTPIHRASQNGYIEIVKFLVEKGADVNATNKDHQTPLHYANRKLEVVKLLLESGANINATDAHGNTPLYYAVYDDKFEVVKYLVESGTDINAKGDYGRTALHIAALSGYIEIVKYLVESEADIDAKDKDGNTPLHWGAQNNKPEVIVKLLAESGSDVNAKNNSGWTSLHFAAFNGFLEVAKILVVNGADLSIKNSEGNTALHVATTRNKYGIVKLLADTGVGIDIKNNDRKRALDIARNDKKDLSTNKSKQNTFDSTEREDHSNHKWSQHIPNPICKSSQTKRLCEDVFPTTTSSSSTNPTETTHTMMFWDEMQGDNARVCFSPQNTTLPSRSLPANTKRQLLAISFSPFVSVHSGFRGESLQFCWLCGREDAREDHGIVYFGKIRRHSTNITISLLASLIQQIQSILSCDTFEKILSNLLCPATMRAVQTKKWVFETCPLCMEAFDFDDLNFYPCTCHYQICRFCWHRLKTDENGLCPACRQPYPENPVNYQPVSGSELQKFKSKSKTSSKNGKTKTADSRKHLGNYRVLQKNLVYVVGLSQKLAEVEVVVGTTPILNNVGQQTSCTAYVTYARDDDALRAIEAVNNAVLDGRLLKASLGTTKYCSTFLRGQMCHKATGGKMMCFKEYP